MEEVQEQREARKRWRKFRSKEKHGKGGGNSGAKRSTKKVEEIQEQREARKRWRKFRSSKYEKSKAKADCSVLTTANHLEVY